MASMTASLSLGVWELKFAKSISTTEGSSVAGRLRQIESLYQEWFLTDEFVNREIANVEARVIK